ncbi:MAG: ribonuclease P protein component [Eubacterium sp.]|jgi:ribonuclease P protein component|nr:ribonuclease P protein component [Eubacterium sp.]
MTDNKKKYAALKKNGEFQFLFKKGKSVVTYAFVCYYLLSRRRANRCGIITSKKIGNAVKRNRARRVIKEAFRYFEPLVREKTDRRYDFVFVARVQTPEIKSDRVLSLMKKKLFDLL